jgi:hypothetical protein
MGLSATRIGFASAPSAQNPPTIQAAIFDLTVPGCPFNSFIIIDPASSDTLPVNADGAVGQVNIINISTSAGDVASWYIPAVGTSPSIYQIGSVSSIVTGNPSLTINGKDSVSDPSPLIEQVGAAIYALTTQGLLGPLAALANSGAVPGLSIGNIG